MLSLLGRIAIAAALAAGLCTQTVTMPALQPEMSVTVIDYGQAPLPGDAILVSSAGHHLLMDTGLSDNEENYDDCSTIRYLKENGIDTLDLYLSHYHDDHYILLCTIMEDPFFHVEHLYLPYADMLLQYSDYAYMWETWYPALTKNLSLSGSWGVNSQTAILQTAEEKGIPVTIFSKGDRFTLGWASVEILWLDTSVFPEGENATDAINLASAAAMVRGGGIRYLTCGDMYVKNEEDMLAAGIDVRAEILKLNHHGGETSNCEAFLQAVSPTYAILTDYPHRQLWSDKSRRAVEAVRAAGAVVMSPRRHGTFTYVCRGGEISVTGGKRNREEWDRIGQKEEAPPAVQEDPSPVHHEPEGAEVQ